MTLHFSQPLADLYIPDGLATDAALARVTHLAVGAHQDDLEFMAWHGILDCYGQPDRWFAGVTCTDGAGSPRTGIYASCSDDDMKAIRRDEQRRAAAIGRYAAMAQLHHPSRLVKDPQARELVAELKALLLATRPRVVYTHNLADKHDTHVAVALALIRALRELPADARPERLLGCEVWRGLDWLPDAEKVLLDVSAREHLAAALMGVYDSQIAGGKRYDLGTFGRRRANATYFESHQVDVAEQLNFAMDLTPLVADPSLDITEFAAGFARRLEAEIRQRLAKLS